MSTCVPIYAWHIYTLCSTKIRHEEAARTTYGAELVLEVVDAGAEVVRAAPQDLLPDGRSPALAARDFHRGQTRVRAAPRNRAAGARAQPSLVDGLCRVADGRKEGTTELHHKDTSAKT